jgi:hypothetical protein
MKKEASLVFFIVALGVMPVLAKDDACTTIKEGLLTYGGTYDQYHYLAETPLMTGYDPYGYNFKAHMFHGLYPNTYLAEIGFPPFDGDTEAYSAANPDAVLVLPDVHIIVKWNDAYLSNRDCDGDGKLDEHRAFPSYVGSGAWVTNYMSRRYSQEGKSCHWSYFIRVVAVPADAYSDGSMWYSEEGTEIGMDVGMGLALIQDVYRDPCQGYHGVSNLSPAVRGWENIKSNLLWKSGARDHFSPQAP